MASTGLLIIILGWVIQLISVYTGAKRIRMSFVLMYCLGVILLVIEGYNSGIQSFAILNFATFVLAAFVLLKLKK